MREGLFISGIDQAAAGKNEQCHDGDEMCDGAEQYEDMPDFGWKLKFT